MSSYLQSTPVVSPAAIHAAPLAPSLVDEPDPRGYRCPECDATSALRKGTKCRFCVSWKRQVTKVFARVWNETMADLMASAPVTADYPTKRAYHLDAQRQATAAAAAARRAVLVAAIEACAEAHAEMAGAA